jgi:hypothetical protein
VSRNLLAEAFQQDCLKFRRAADMSFANRDAGACGQRDISRGDLLELGEDLGRIVVKVCTPMKWATGTFDVGQHYGDVG